MTAPSYQFGPYRIDPSARELMHADRLVTLSPKVFDCLAYLIEHRDRAVGRDELIAAVWGKVDVTDTLLGQTILKARRAIGDTGSGQNAIRTIPRFGYRWVGELSDASPPNIEVARSPEDDERTVTPTPIQTDVGNAPPARRRVPLRWVQAALALLTARCNWPIFLPNRTSPFRPDGI